MSLLIRKNIQSLASSGPTNSVDPHAANILGRLTAGFLGQPSAFSGVWGSSKLDSPADVFLEHFIRT